MPRIVPELEFRDALETAVFAIGHLPIGAVTGPGRSGAIASVYASHYLGVPFIPYGQKHPRQLGRLLIIDTATESGATLRKAARKYEAETPIVLAIYHEPPRVAFWYEAPKPQRFRHELARAA